MFNSDTSPLKDWKLGRLNHVAIAVPDLDKATTLYRDVLGAHVSDVVVRTSHYLFSKRCHCFIPLSSLSQNMASTLYLLNWATPKLR